MGRDSDSDTELIIKEIKWQTLRLEAEMKNILTVLGHLIKYINKDNDSSGENYVQ